MMSALLHFLGYSKYPLLLASIVYILKGGPRFKAALDAGGAVSSAPGVDQIGVALILAGLGLAAGNLSNPKRDEVIRTGHASTVALAGLGLILGLAFVLFVPVLVVATEVRLADTLALGTLSLGIGMLGEVRATLSRNGIY